MRPETTPEVVSRKEIVEVEGAYRELLGHKGSVLVATGTLRSKQNAETMGPETFLTGESGNSQVFLTSRTVRTLQRRVGRRF